MREVLLNFFGDRVARYSLPMRAMLGRPFLRFRADPQVVQLQRNTDLYARAQNALQNFLEAKGLEDYPKDQLDALKVSSARLWKEVYAAAELILVEPDVDRSVIEHLVKTERVHPITQKGEAITDDHVREFRTNRLGMQGMDKDCVLFQIQTSEGPKFLGQIYRKHACIPEENGMIDVRDIEGNVDIMKSRACAQIDEDTINITYYWSISSQAPGAGEAIIAKLATITPADRFETTASPSHGEPKTTFGFTKNYDRAEIFALDDDEIRRRVMDHLLNEKDGVRDFHVGNGASVGWIQINRDCPLESEDWVTINYFYDRPSAQRNRDIYNKGKGQLPVSAAVMNYLPKGQENAVFNVNRSYLVARPALAA